MGANLPPETLSTLQTSSLPIMAMPLLRGAAPRRVGDPQSVAQRGDEDTPPAPKPQNRAKPATRYTPRRPEAGTPAHDEWWKKRRLQLVPEIWRKDVHGGWADRMSAAKDSEAKRHANLWLLELSERIGRAGVCGLALDATDEEVRSAARDACESLDELAQQFVHGGFASIRAAAVAYCERRGITPPESKFDDESALVRMLDKDWWVRRVRAAHAREIEGQAILLGRVWRKREAFCSNLTLERRRQQQARNAAALESRVAVNQNGDEYLLAELAEVGVSDPENRVAELLTRIKGLEEEAQKRMDEGWFVTLTCPSRMHARLHNGKANPKYDGSSPRDAQKHLATCWAQVRAVLDRKGLKVYGVRVCEPHHDGTPHWHMLVFCKNGHGAAIQDVFRRYFLLKHDAAEEGAARYRVKAEALDWSRGSAVGYLVKYVCKNISGATMPDDDDETGMPGEQRSERVEAWAACWGIRQFQVFGGPDVGVWRELRRISSEQAATPAIEEARKHADAADWAGYVRSMGGVLAKRDERPITLAKTEPGCAWSALTQSQYAEETRYGEPWPKTAYGVQDCAKRSVVVTRHLDWEVKPSGSDAARNRAKQRQEDRRRTHMRGGLPLPPRTCVTNCTDREAVSQAPRGSRVDFGGVHVVSGSFQSHPGRQTRTGQDEIH